MNFKVNPQSSVPLYAQIVEQIRNLILSGQLKKNANLPSVRELSEQLEVNSLTIQKALKLLENEKYIVIKRGVGAFVADTVESLNAKDRESLILPGLNNVVTQAKELGMAHSRFQKMVKESWGSHEDIPDEEGVIA